MKTREMKTREMKRKRKIGLFDFCVTIFMIFILVIMAYPLYYTVIASLSEAGAVASGDVIWKPVKLTLDAYKHVFAYDAIWTGYANSIFYTVLGTLFSLVLTIPAAYALSKKELPFGNAIMTVFLITMYFGGGMVAGYLWVKRLGLLDTRLVLILTSGVSVYNVIVTRMYFKSSIPDSLYDAADVDGAGEGKKFFSIALPLAKSIIAVMTLYYAVGQWNNYFSALLYVKNRELEPLQMVLRRVLIQNENALNEQVLVATSTEQLLDSVRRSQMAYTMKYAMVFIGSAPMLCIYPFVQKHFVKGVMIGSVKG